MIACGMCKCMCKYCMQIKTCFIFSMLQFPTIIYIYIYIYLEGELLNLLKKTPKIAPPPEKKGKKKKIQNTSNVV